MFIVQRVIAPLYVFVMERILGWRLEDNTPDAPKFIMLTEPHTSNWDVGIMFYWACKHRRRVHYVIKKEAAQWFLINRFLRWTGAIFIDRDAPLSALKTILRESRAHERFVLLIAPSGTRGYTSGWKPGFYYIAQKTKMPLLLTGPDYRTKVGRVGGLFHPTGDVHADIETMRAFYEPIVARHPELAAPVRLLAENDEPMTV